jgi:hypothetical protein
MRETTGLHQEGVHTLDNEGSAFVISILVLFVLSVLGIALMLTTTTEKDIAINYRWGEQAFFNADAALEYGKNVLAAHLLAEGDFNEILPPPRPDITVDFDADWGEALPEPPPCSPSSPGWRAYPYFVDRCPPGGGGPCVRVYIGKVLQRPDQTPLLNDFRVPGASVPGDLDGDGVADIEGTFTIWVRRPIVGTQDYGLAGANGEEMNDRVILTAEGTAPGPLGAGGRAVSIRRLELMVRRPTGGIEGDIYGGPSSLSGQGSAGTSYTRAE